MSVLSCNNICLAYGTVDILSNISFSINSGARLGIIGSNGSGKSTLMRIIAGAQQQDSGTVTIAPQVKMAYLEQHADLSFDGKTVKEVVFERFSDLVNIENELLILESMLDSGDKIIIEKYDNLNTRFRTLGGFEYKSKVMGLIKKLGFGNSDLDFPADKLSGGQKARLSIASILLTQPDIVLLDEPTNHLDIDTALWLENQLKCLKSTLLIVSHDRYFLDRIATEVLELENTHSIYFKGNYTQFKEKKKKQNEAQAKHYQLQQKEIARLEAFIENQRKWNRERNIIAAESRMKAIGRMKLIDKPQNAPDAVRISIETSTKSSYDVLSVRNLSKSFSSRELFSNLSFELKKNDRLFIVGGNGTGKSTLLKIITGNLDADSGISELGYNQQPGYYDQEQLLLDDSLDVITQLWNTYPDMTQTQLRGALASYGFYGDDVFKKVSDLSGGEKARLAIAKLVLSGSSLLILDEPTNHLDISTKEVLEEALKNYNGTLLCVSHDRYFISSLSTRILELSPSHSNGYKIYEFGYDEYTERRLSGNDIQKSTTPKSNAGADDFVQMKQEKSKRKKEEKRIAFLENNISKCESRISEIENLYSEYSSDYVKLQELENEKLEAEALLEIYYEEFFELSENK